MFVDRKQIEYFLKVFIVFVIKSNLKDAFLINWIKFTSKPVWSKILSIHYVSTQMTNTCIISHMIYLMGYMTYLNDKHG